MINRVRSYNTATPGRSLNEVRGHHFVIDEPPYAGGPGEEITPADAFLAGVSACGVLLVEGYARRQGFPLASVEATLAGIRERSDTTRFARVNLRFELVGPTQAQAEEAVASYQGH